MLSAALHRAAHQNLCECFVLSLLLPSSITHTQTRIDFFTQGYFRELFHNFAFFSGLLYFLFESLVHLNTTCMFGESPTY